MTKLFAWLFAAALVLGLGTTSTLTYAEDPVEEAEEGGPDSGDENDEDEKEEGE